MAHLIETRSASTANVLYRALQQFIKWLQDEEIDRSPMERMRPPIVPEKPVPVLTEVRLRTLLQGTKGNSFVDRRDNAILRLLLDTAGRMSEVAGLTVSDVDVDNDVVQAPVTNCLYSLPGHREPRQGRCPELVDGRP